MRSEKYLGVLESGPDEAPLPAAPRPALALAPAQGFHGGSYAAHRFGAKRVQFGLDGAGADEPIRDAFVILAGEAG